MSLKSSLLFVTLLVAGMLAPVSQARLFLTGKNYQSGELPVAATVQDFNHDGIADIASANQDSRNVSVFLGKPDGTFVKARPHTFPVGRGAVDVASGDLNGDGNADLVVTDGIISVNVALGRGDGTFGPASPSRLTEDETDAPQGIAIGDLNFDGILDLAIAISDTTYGSDGKVAVLLGQGDGSFARPVFYSLMENATRLVATDLNNDGVPDLAVAINVFQDHAMGLALLRGNGDGTFQPAVLSVGGASSTDVAAADFNGDGNMDLALAQGFDSGVWIILGNGDGTFLPATTFPLPGLASRVRAADVSGDGVPDLLVSDDPKVLLGDGTGGFGAPVDYGIGVNFAETGDFNQDGIADILAGGSHEIVVAFGSGHGAFRAPLNYFTGNTDFLGGFDLADFDGDGAADIVVSNGTRDYAQLTFLHGFGDGTFAEFTPLADVFGNAVIAADFNNDSKSDVLVVPEYDRRFYTILGNGDGTFQSPLATAVESGVFDAALGDFNSDGNIDVVLAATGTSHFFVLLGNGNGTFRPAIRTGARSYTQSPVVADFNLDGNPDLAIVHYSYPDGVDIYLGHGDGTFYPPLFVDYSYPFHATAGDLNQDGKPDLVVDGNGDGQPIEVFLGNGDGSFQSPKSIYPNSGALKTADVDGDGRLDVVAGLNSVGLAVLRGKGDGTFYLGKEFPTGSPSVVDLVLRDLDGDERPEVIASPPQQNLTVLLNTSRGR